MPLSCLYFYSTTFVQNKTEQIRYSLVQHARREVTINVHACNVETIDC